MEMKFPEKGFAGKVVLKDADKDVSWLWIQDMDISFSGRAVKTGGIAGVGTENEHRGKGYSRQILTSSVALMKKHKVPLSLLYGIRHYYTKYGYAVVYPDYRTGVHVFFAKRLPQLKGYVWRKIEPDDVRAVIRLYNKTCWPRTGMRARNPGKYRFFKGSNWNAVPEPFGLFRKGKLSAYTVLDLKPDGVEVVDAASASYEDGMALVSCLAAEAVERCTSDIILHLPPDFPLVVACRRFGGELRVGFEADGGAMARIIHLESFLTQIAPLLRERAGHGWSALFDTGDQRALIRMSKSGAEVARAKKSTKATVTIRTTPGGLAQLFYGYRPLDEMCLAGHAAVKGKTGLAEKFFRSEWAHMMLTDHF